MSDKETAEDAVDTGEKRKRGRPKNPKPDTVSIFIDPFIIKTYTCTL